MGAEEGGCGSAAVTGSIEFVLAILLLKIGVGTRRVWRGVEVIEVWFVNNLVNIIQDRVRMNLVLQIDQSFFVVVENPEHNSTLDLTPGTGLTI